MLPSLLVNEIREALQQFLIIGYEPSDPLFAGVMRRFAHEEHRWLKGPYVQVGLPYRTGPGGSAYFGRFEMDRPGYTHQEAAWQRLSSDRDGANTIVATGTGSGKTECFLYPILDHCARAIAQSQAGVKALIVYPMNALASDQARRFAETIARTPFFKGLRVGLFVGGGTGKLAAHPVMTPTSVITDRDTLRKDPPDILLTNYKMLDYLLIRPGDRRLWERNTPTTLRYVVVDELHTFDGAQGTDLALLLRRLKARLLTPENHLICVGTSATLGASSDTAPLCEYARQVFAAPFPPGAVITENRQSMAEFLEDSVIEYLLQPRADFAERLDSSRYTDQKAVIAAYFDLFFPGLPAPPDVADSAWRAGLGRLLKRHLLFQNLLKILRGQIVNLADLEQQLQTPLPQAARPHIRPVLDALLALISYARDPVDPTLPLVTVRVQLWLRELRRMVARVTANPEQIALRASGDLKADPGTLYLPLIQCVDCHTTGWLARLLNGQSRVRTELDEIYNTWFSHQPETVRLYALEGVKSPLCDGLPGRLCAACGTLQTTPGPCHACGTDELVEVFQVTATTSSAAGGVARVWHDPICPVCGSRDRQIIVGARNATLAAVVVEQLWASPNNDDKKLIAFSDSVQDAAHRAGFFAARTYGATTRTAIAKGIDQLPMPCHWPVFLEKVANVWLEHGSPLELSRERFVSEFIGPNMTWQSDWAEAIQKSGGLPVSSHLPERVRKRLTWQAFAEFTYQSRRGRNLDAIGKATLAPSPERIDAAVSTLLPRLREDFGLRHLDHTTVFQWLWGFLCHLRWRGAVMNPALTSYAGDANVYALAHTQGRGEWLPPMSPNTPHPVFLTLGHHKGFDTITRSVGTTWYQTWLVATLGATGLLPQRAETELYTEAIAALEQAGLLIRTDAAFGASIALDPAGLSLHTDVAFLLSPLAGRRLTVPRDVITRLINMPCPDAPAERYATIEEAGGWHARRFSASDLRRVFTAEHTGLLSRKQREEVEARFKSENPKPWYENLLSATPTLELGVDIGTLSAVLLCSVPPNRASYLQRIGRAGRRDGSAVITTLADGTSPHDLYFFDDTNEMLSGEVTPPGVFLQASEVLRRQLFAFCLDQWVGSGVPVTALPDKTAPALDARDTVDQTRFPYTFLDYLQRNEAPLLIGFLALLKDDKDDRIEERLTAFMRGTDDEDSLRLRLSKLLDELVIERRAYRKRSEQIKNQIKTLKAKPQDEATRAETDGLDRERQKLLELVREINQRDLLNTLTDAGLIPNYAFPEAGVELKSLLWRKRADGEQTSSGGAFVSLPVERYERPAHSALSEFAPENSFYANQRRVEIDQINLNLSSLEWWRLCPSCHHMENLERHPDSQPACPKCHDPMWSNVSQRRQLLRFKQAMATSDDVAARIDDSAEDREPKFYVRQMLADFDMASILVAYRLKATDLPFGFEFIARAQFRDINFGEGARPGDSYRVADEERSRPGFKLCRYCGKVQVAHRKGREKEKDQDHAFDCEKRGSDDPENILECLYLYREFASEALRILVPYTQSGVDEEAVQSFMAAFQLGLKRRFGGKVDHLRAMTCDEPGKEGGPKRSYVLLYDSVPGGTGYLHQLLANEAQTLVDVLHLALTTLATCACNADPEKDGCYRCVYQYRLGRAMTMVSRDRARAILEHLVLALDQLEKVATIADIYINPNFDSELEARFIESLRRLGGKQGLPFVKLVQDIVGGKAGYLMEVDGQRYWIEPQVDLGPSDNVAVSCRPDFVLRPVQSKSKRRPIAVFCDGWAYHRDSTREDARKRNALVTGGRYWVWSVTWEDVQSALDESPDTALQSALNDRCYNPLAGLPAVVRNQLDPAMFQRNAVATLLHWLGKPPDRDTDPYTVRMARSAGVVAFRMIPNPSDATLDNARAELVQFWTGQPRLQDKPAGSVACGNVGYPVTALRYWWPPSLADSQKIIEISPGFVVYEDTVTSDEQTRHEAWRLWLWLFNTFQTLPGMALATRSGLDARDYDDLTFTEAVHPAGSAHASAHATAWQDVIDHAMADLFPDLEALLAEGLPPPDEVGFELAEADEVIAEAELAWTDRKLVVLMAHQAEYRPVWLSRDWRVVLVEQEWLPTLRAELEEGAER